MLPTITLPKVNTGPFVFGAAPSRATTMGFREWVAVANHRYRWHTANRVLANVLQRVADDELKRVMVFMHPRSGKSEEVSRLFSAYYLYRHPERWVGLTSYGAELAYTLSRNARQNYVAAGGGVRGDAAAVKHWETADGGGMWAAGVGGPILGKGFHLGIIDDPIKNAEDAASETIRDKQRDWWRSTFATRQEPGAAIVVIQQRWREDDLCGWLLEQEKDAPQGWHIVHFEALKEDEPPDYPDTCTLEPDWREPGEALIPERYDADKLAQLQRELGSYFFSALYQQRPSPREGGMFKRDWFDIVPTLPPGGSFVRYWDKAGTQDAGAYTAGVLLAEAEGTYYVCDMTMGQWSAGQRERVIRQTAFTDRQFARQHGSETYRISIEQEPGSGGKESADNTVRDTLRGFSAHKDKVTGSKELRAEPVAAQAEVRNIKLVEGDWNGRFLEIVTAFPTGKIKDPVDALSGAFNRFAGSYSAGSKRYA